MEDFSISWERIIHPDPEQLRKRDEFLNGINVETLGMRSWIDKLYLEIKSRWNRIRVLPDANSDECAFLVHLMEEIEEHTDD